MTPYIQNFTLSVTRDTYRELEPGRSLHRHPRLEAERHTSISISPNVFYNPALFDALATHAQRRERRICSIRCSWGLNLIPVYSVRSTNPTACAAPSTEQRSEDPQHLRLNSTFRDALANGDFATVANALNIFNGFGTGAAGAVDGVPGERGTVLEASEQGIQRAGRNYGRRRSGRAGGTVPGKLDLANPQFNQANFYTNSGKSNYHSLQVQSTLRPTQGSSSQGTYVWSRAFEVLLARRAFTRTRPKETRTTR